MKTVIPAIQTRLALLVLGLFFFMIGCQSPSEKFVQDELKVPPVQAQPQILIPEEKTEPAQTTPVPEVSESMAKKNPFPAEKKKTPKMPRPLDNLLPTPKEEKKEMVYAGRITNVIKVPTTGQYRGKVTHPEWFAQHEFTSPVPVTYGEEVQYNLLPDGTAFLLNEQKGQGQKGESAEKKAKTELTELNVGRIVTQRRNRNREYVGELIDMDGVVRARRVSYVSPFPVTTADTVYYQMNGDKAEIIKRI